MKSGLKIALSSLSLLMLFVSPALGDVFSPSSGASAFSPVAFLIVAGGGALGIGAYLAYQHGRGFFNWARYAFVAPYRPRPEDQLVVQEILAASPDMETARQRIALRLGINEMQAAQAITRFSGIAAPMGVEELPPFIVYGGVEKSGGRIAARKVGREIAKARTKDIAKREIINKFQNAKPVVPPPKLGYLTNPSKGKAQGFETLGYTKENLVELERLLLEQQRTIKGMETIRETQYGPTVNIVNDIMGLNGKRGRLTTVWILKDGEMQFVTAWAKPLG